MSCARVLAASSIPVFTALTDFQEQHPAPVRRFRWAELMKRVFEIDVLRCDRCGSRREVRDRGYWLAAAELDGGNGTRELVASGYGGASFC